MEPSERMNKLLLALRMKPLDLARSIGREREDIITNVIKGKNGISRNLVYLITNSHNQVNPEWLFSDKGEMFLSDISLPVSKQVNNCLLCQEKERYIKSLEDRIECQKIYIDTLKSQEEEKSSAPEAEKKKAR